MITDPLFDTLEPALVWRHFAALCAIPHPSKHEGPLRDYLTSWAQKRSLTVRTDPAGNLILSKPASPGRENSPGVILQGHLDMVCQKLPEHPHDFLLDPLQPEQENGWLFTRNTTLGADNGIGVALALAALEDERLVHGPLEVLLTADEEAGMGGVRGLQPGTLTGTYLLNLDTEEWGHFYLGCAGGVELLASLPAPTQAPPTDQVAWRLCLGGLVGGHSGIDIHRDRGHAIKALAHVLDHLQKELSFRVADLQGGSVRNALPREASALLVLSPDQADRLAPLVARAEAHLRQRYETSDPQLSLRLQAAEPAPVMDEDASAALLALLLAAPCGVARMSEDFPGVVETSNNLGTLNLTNGVCQIGFLVRSLVAEEQMTLAQHIAEQVAGAGGEALIQGAYPGWTPNPASPLLARCQEVYRREFGTQAGTQVIHAGLECGLLAASHPQLEMISFGPDIQGAHAPGERVEVASVGHCWHLLTALLADLSQTERSAP